jgi:hypothetical protein
MKLCRALNVDVFIEVDGWDLEAKIKRRRNKNPR